VAALPADRVRLRGLMSIPEPTDDLVRQRRQHAELRRLLFELRAQLHLDRRLGDAGHRLDTLSMGMSADLEAAIAEGSTLVRVGSAIFGTRG
jgi:hypothetical protein